jgi:Zn-finger nucleic acid-binding protein
MKCPNDQTTLLISERQGIEIDYCPECRGVWLDRGELDKLIEKNTTSLGTSRPYDSESNKSNDSHYRQPHDTRHDSSYQHSPQKKKHRESFLGDLFDF